MPSGYMQQVTRANANNNNAEILNQFNWDIKVINWAKGVYYPGYDIFRGRLYSVGSLPSYSHSISEITELPGGFKNVQPGDVDHNGCSVSLEFQDFADSSIGYMFKDYMDKIDNPSNKTSLPKEYLVVDFDIYQLNALRQPVKMWKLRTGILADFNSSENFANRKEANGKVSATFNFEWWDTQYLNTIPLTNS